MSASRPISALRTVWLVARLSLRRLLNMWQSARLRFRKAKPTAPVDAGRLVRSATPGKSRGRSVFGVAVLLLMLLNGFNIGSRGLLNLSDTSRDVTVSSEAIPVSNYTEARLRNAEEALRRARELPDPTQREQSLAAWNRYVDSLFLWEVRRESLTEDEESKRIEHMREVFDKQGTTGFVSQPKETFWVSGETWPRSAQAGSIFFRSLGVVVLLWMVFIVFSSLGMNNRNLGEVEWSFEWLYTFPASARALFASKLFVYSFLNPLLWLFFLPFLILVYIAAGYGAMAIPIGLGVLVYLGLLAGALCTFLEVALRKFLTLQQLKNIQALSTIIGTAALLVAYASCLSKPLDDFLVARAKAMPEFLAWHPFSLPLVLALPSAPRSQLGMILAVMVVLVFGFCAAALVGSEWLTRDGLIKAAGPYQGTRKVSAGRPGAKWLGAIPGHELLLLARDRNLLVQVLVVPLLVPGFYLLINARMVSAVSGNFRHAAVLAFGVGAYSFLSSAVNVLNREDKTLWQLLTFPQSLATILLKKTVVWAGLGLLYGGATLLLISSFSHHLHASSWGQAFLALYGIALYAFIASGIGILATNVLETERRARFRTDMLYLYMLLAAMFANTIYSPSLWTKLAQLVLSTLLAYALWQKVKDAAPYLLDPVAQPPGRLSLADGMIAALAFFIAQGLLFAFIHAVAKISVPAQITFAYVCAGFFVAASALLILWRQNVPDLWREMGLSRQRHEAASQTLAGSLLGAVALGAVAGFGAILYVRVLDLFPQGQIWKQDAELSSFLSRAGRPFWICMLAIAAAPIFEEFLFRGLIFQGLRRSTGPALAVLGSAALFALVHPPISVIPVFVLGIAAAISFQRSGLLLTPVLTHAVYNTIVIFLNRS